MQMRNDVDVVFCATNAVQMAIFTSTNTENVLVKLFAIGFGKRFLFVFGAKNKVIDNLCVGRHYRFRSM